MIRIYKPVRVARNAVLSAAVAGAGLAGLLGATAGVAHASVGKADGYVTVASCNSANGTVKYTPGLTSVSQNTTAALSGFVAGCGNEGGKEPGFGKLVANMTGSASINSENFTSSGTFTLTWPTGAQSEGTLSATESNGAENVFGFITSGPYTNGAISGSYIITSQKGKGTAASPAKSQTFLTSTPLIIQENTG
jgi:hypothetical protein